MPYPYQDLLAQLRFYASPLQYEQALRTKPAKARPEDQLRPPAYRELLPAYTFAICPFCGVECREGFDTYRLQSHNLLYWQLERRYGRTDPFPQNAPCLHFVGVHLFYNLHGVDHLPLEFFAARSGDVPYLTDRFFRTEGVHTVVTLHALPVCELIDNVFTPMYTTYILTYFVNDRTRYFQSYLNEQQEAFERFERSSARSGSRDDFHPDNLVVAPPYGNFDLVAACTEGRLGWLDIRDYPDVTLKLHQNLALPEKYQDIEGYRSKYAWFEGKFRVD